MCIARCQRNSQNPTVGLALVIQRLSPKFKIRKSVSSVGLVNALVISKYEPYCILALTFFPTRAGRIAAENRLRIL